MAMDKEGKLSIINEILKSEENLDEKKYILNLKKIYLKNMKITNPEDFENKIYKGKNYKEKYYFELKRINDYLSLYPNKQIEKDLKVLNAKENILVKKNTENLYKKMLLNIIYIETKMKMKIGLVVEFNDYIDYYLKKYINKDIYYLDDNFNIKDKKIYNRK